MVTMVTKAAGFQTPASNKEQTIDWAALRRFVEAGRHYTLDYLGRQGDRVVLPMLIYDEAERQGYDMRPYLRDKFMPRM
jgi:hypothetical protein